jgi:membrane protease YdiL (CAAX protease family)
MDQELPTSDAACFAPWSLGEALIIGLIGLFVFVGTLAALNFIWRPIFGLSRFETQVLDVNIESLAIGAAGYLSVLIWRKRAVEGFWQSIEWSASPIQMITFAVVGLIASLGLRAAMTRQLIPGRLSGLHSGALLFALILSSAFLMQPILEEVYFRGILFAGIASKLDTAKSIFLVTVIFDLGHPQHRLIVLPIAIALGITRVSTRSTANCFALHAAYNLGVILWGVR